VLYAATPIAQAHGEPRQRQLIAIVLTGLLGVLSWCWPPATRPRSPLNRKLEWLVVLIPAYAWFQAVPLPIWVVRVVSPARARLADGLGPIGLKPSWVPISVTPPAAVYHGALLAACAVIFLVVWAIGLRLWAHPWVVVIPLLLLGVGEAVLGIVQAGQSSGRMEVASGTFEIRNHFSGFLEMILPFAVLQAVATWSRRTARERDDASAGLALRACLGCVCAALILAGILCSRSRMGFATALATLTFVALVGLGRGRSWRQIWRVWIAVGVLAALAIVFLPSNEVAARLSGDVRGEDRPKVWRDTRALIAAYPLFGCGLGGYESAFVQYKNSNPTLAQDYAHNDYLQYLAELGLFGVALAAWPLAMILAKLREGWLQRSNPERAWLSLACAGSALAIGLHSLVDFNLYVPANMMAFAWVLGIARACGEPVKQRREVSRHVEEEFTPRA